MNLIVLCIALPLLAAFLLPVLMRSLPGAALWAGPGVLLFGAWLAADSWAQLDGTAISVAIGGFAPPLGINLYVDRLALLLTLASQLLGLLCWPFRIDRDSARRQALTLILVAACSGMALSGDLFNLYVFFELATVASFGLVAAGGSGAASLATLRYLLLSGLGSVLMLTGITLIYVRTGSLSLAQLAQLAPTRLDDATGLAAFLAILIGLGVKAELFPLNSWVPEVYSSAPARVSAILAGLVSKLAVVIVVRLMILLFPQPEAAQTLLLLGLLGVISGELTAWRARDMRRLLAFSSIGQLGMIFIAFSIPGMGGVYAGLALAMHHLLIKPGLFLLTQRWDAALHKLRGLGLAEPLAGGLFVLFCLSLIGVPPLPGFWAKYLLVTHLMAQSNPLYLAALAIFLGATVIEASYLFRVIGRLFQREAPEGVPLSVARGTTDTLSGLLAAGLMGIGVILATTAIAPLAEGLEAIAGETLDNTRYIETVFPPQRLPGKP